MSPERIKELEQKFIDECTHYGDYDELETIPQFKTVFQWFVENFKIEEPKCECGNDMLAEYLCPRCYNT